jgi:hypothetical protein
VRLDHLLSKEHAFHRCGGQVPVQPVGGCGVLDGGDTGELLVGRGNLSLYCLPFGWVWNGGLLGLVGGVSILLGPERTTVGCFFGLPACCRHADSFTMALRGSGWGVVCVGVVVGSGCWLSCA